MFQIIVKEKGVFTNVTSPSTKAKLRILFEVAPLALLVRRCQRVMPMKPAPSTTKDALYMSQRWLCCLSSSCPRGYMLKLAAYACPHLTICPSRKSRNKQIEVLKRCMWRLCWMHAAHAYSRLLHPYKPQIWELSIHICAAAPQIEKAGGYSSADGKCISGLDVPIEAYDQRTQICYGSLAEVRRISCVAAVLGCCKSWLIPCPLQHYESGCIWVVLGL